MEIKMKGLDKLRAREPEDIYTIMRLIFKREREIDRTKEHFWVVALDTGYKILNIELVGLGTTKRVNVSPPEVFGIPISKHANSIVLVHNHPGGSLKPSEADKDITDRLIQTGFIMNCRVFDHLIITEDSYFSFADSGLLRELERSKRYALTFVYERIMKEDKERIKKQAEHDKKEIAKESKEKGIRKGKKEGRKERSKELAELMLREGISMDSVQRLTGLPKTWLGRIKNTLEEEKEKDNYSQMLQHVEKDLEEKNSA